MAAISQKTFLNVFFKNENAKILIRISMKFVLNGPIKNIPALVQIMAWHRPGDKPLSEPMMISLLTHICVARPQWVKIIVNSDAIWRHRLGLTLAQAKALYLTAPSHYLNLCWLIMKSDLWHSHQINFIRSAHELNRQHVFWDDACKIAAT